jgi:hypothetical protein
MFAFSNLWHEINLFNLGVNIFIYILAYAFIKFVVAKIDALFKVNKVNKVDSPPDYTNKKFQTLYATCDSDGIRFEEYYTEDSSDETNTTTETEDTSITSYRQKVKIV